MTMQRWKITIQYDGTNYHGWQRQKAEVPTIQQSIEQAIYKFSNQEVTIQGAGRTDAGVHAFGHIAHFDLDYGTRDLDDYTLAKALNAHLNHEPIAIINAEKTDNDFHARFNAKNKLYRYRVVARKSSPVMDREFVWHVRRDLDITAIQESAKHLIGTHDFSSFRDAECQAESPIKTIDRLAIISTPYDDFGGIHLAIEIEGKGFLHHQCRNIVGTLIDVGKGRTTTDGMKKILEAKDRTKAGPTAPSQGLSLIKIDY